MVAEVLARAGPNIRNSEFKKQSGVRPTASMGALGVVALQRRDFMARIRLEARRDKAPRAVCGAAPSPASAV